MNLHRVPVAALACLATVAVPSLLQAQNKVPGEKWKQSVSVEMAGFKMPARSVEVCVPVGKAEQALAKPPEQENCSVSNEKRSGNKFSADITCTGKNAMTGHIETTTEGNRNFGKMQMNVEGQTMNMAFDSTKLGTACEATDYEAVANKLQADANKQQVALCDDFASKFRKDPRQIAGAAAMYTDKTSGMCKSHASFKDFCSTAQTTGGFASLSSTEKQSIKNGMSNVPGGKPLTATLEACSLGGADALRTKLLATAVKEDNWDFQIQEGNDATWANLVAIAKRECSGRSFTNQPPSRYTSLCSQYGTALARGDRAGAQNVALSNPSYRSSGSSGDTATVPVSNEPAAAQPASEDQGSKAKARDALDKGKQKLKGLFGGGN